MDRRGRGASRRGLIAIGAATLLFSTLAVTNAAAAVATPDLWVATPGLGGATWNHCTTADSPCDTIQRAVDLAADPANAGHPVAIHLSPGTFPAAEVHIHAGSQSALTLTGYRSSGTTATVLTPGPSATGQLDALRIDTVGFPVTINHLSVGPARGAAGSATAVGADGADGTSVHGILSLSTAPLSIDDVRISGLTGGDGTAGGQGGDVIGIAHAGLTTVTATVISGLHGGAGGPGGNGPAPSSGGVGGSATAVVVSLPAGQNLTVGQSQFTDAVGGVGGAGGARTDGDQPGAAGGDGGTAVGVQVNGDASSIAAVTVARMQGGPGGAGGAGHALQGAPDTGSAGVGGEADGLLITGVGAAGPATTSVLNSTLSDNVGGPGGPGAGINLGLTSGGTGTASLVHNTVVNNRGGPGTAGPSGGVVADGPQVLLAASLLDNPAQGGPAVNCVHAGSGKLVDSGYNAVSDPAAPSCGSASTDVATTADDLGPLQNNGGLTDTRALSSGSAAAKAVDAAAASAVGQSNYCAGAVLGLDQRSIARSGVGHCAAGAFEPQAPPPPPAQAAPAKPVAAKPVPASPTIVKPGAGDPPRPHGRWQPAPYQGPRTKIAPGHHRPGHKTHHRHHGKHRH